MKDKHIIRLLESMPFASLSEGELTEIRVHTAECLNCGRAFEAAQISSLLLKERTAETFEPSPFFHTRVMASLRERQANDNWGFARLWRTAGALASSMVATVAALAVLTFVTPGNQITSVSQNASSLDSYSAEEMILDQSEVAANPVSDGQVLTAIYDAEEEPVR